MRPSSFNGPISYGGSSYGPSDSWRSGQGAENLMGVGDRGGVDPRDEYGFNEPFTGLGMGNNRQRNEAFAPSPDEMQSLYGAGKSLIDATNQAELQGQMAGTGAVADYVKAKETAQARAKLAKVSNPEPSFLDRLNQGMNVVGSVGGLGKAAGWWGESG